MHAVAWDAVQRLRHERCMQIVFACNRLGYKLECLDIIRSGHCIAVFETDLVLAGCTFMVGHFDFKAHVFKCQGDVPAAVFPEINRLQVEIATGITEFRCGIAILIQFEKEKFRLRAELQVVIAHILHLAHKPLQVGTRVAGKR